MNTQHAKLIAAMVDLYHGDARRIHHFMKVHNFAATIASLENVDPVTTSTLETAAIVHDIGIHTCEAKYGQCGGHFQEIEGPAIARNLLTDLGGYPDDVIDRVCYLVGHHHTYTNVDGIDYQILLEADFLVNAYEDEMSAQAIASFKAKVFKTASGKKLLDDMFRAR